MKKIIARKRKVDFGKDIQKKLQYVQLEKVL